MDLNKRVNKFRLQQERCHASVSSIAAAKPPSSAAATKRQQPPPAAAAAPWPLARPSRAPAVRFSEDTARLQKMYAVRTSAVGSQIKDVIELLYKRRTALTAKQINEATYLHIERNRAVFESLRNNPKVRFDRRFFSYKPKNDVRGKDQVLSLIRSFTDGLPVPELEDAYPSVLQDLQALKSSHDIYWLSGEQGMVYPDDPRSSMKHDAELKALFHEIKLPNGILDIEKVLRRVGEKPMTDTTKRRAAAQIHGRVPKPKKARKKPHGLTSRSRITNAHLPELFAMPMDTKDFM